MIPKLSGNRFLFENWNAAFCINFYNFDENKEFIKDEIIGWCPPSKVFARVRSDEECKDFEAEEIERDELSPNYGVPVIKKFPYAINPELAQQALKEITDE